MLSRLALRSGAQLRLPAVIIRSSTTDVQAGVRDEKNFPRPVRGECGKVRLGFVPEEWFTFFHKKTGVTGPYLFGVGLINYLISKEFYVMEHEYYNGLSILIMVYYFTTRIGPKIGEWVNKELEADEEKWNSGRVNEVKNLKDHNEHIKHEIVRSEAQFILIDAKKENILLQLEGTYRERCMLAYQAAKERLDYQLEKQNIERRIAQKDMVDWIVENVLKAITPDQQKATINQCIGDLTALAGKSK